LKHHPDKVTDPTQRAAATARFQELGHVYRVLSDTRLRAIYDETGGVKADELHANAADDDGRDWAAYWRDLFPPLTAESVRAFEVQYKGTAPPSRALATGT
jgi:DnaJ homolog subfamily C member 9